MFISGVISSRYNVGDRKGSLLWSFTQAGGNFWRSPPRRTPPRTWPLRTSWGFCYGGGQRLRLHFLHGTWSALSKAQIWSYITACWKTLQWLPLLSHKTAHLLCEHTRPFRRCPTPPFPAFLQLPPILQSHKTACTYANSPQSSLFHLLLGFCYVFCLENALLLSAHSAPLGKNCINTTCSQETCLGLAVCPWYLVLSSTVSGCIQMTRSLSPWTLCSKMEKSVPTVRSCVVSRLTAQVWASDSLDLALGFTTHT